jgi:hypothetical protein
MPRVQTADTDGDLVQLERVGCFDIGTYDPWKVKNERKAELDACARFVAPLLASAVHARLYPSNVFEAWRYKFLIPRNRYFEIDLGKNCLRGYETFWRAGAKKGEYLRGTVVVTQPGDFSLASLLKGCVLYGVPSSRYQKLMGNSAAAVRFAENRPHRDHRCFMFSASNGVEYVDVYPPEGCHRSDYFTAVKVANKPGWKNIPP